MRKLSEYKNEEALDLLAEIIEPSAKIFSDKVVLEKIRSDKMGAIKYAIKTYKKEIIEILAAFEGVPVDKYEFTVLTLPMTILQLINDPDVVDFFRSQGLEIEDESSGSATPTTEEEA